MLKESSSTLNVGDRAPDFALPTIERQVVRLSEFRGAPLALLFLRGTW